jgi:hypothetical protein
MTSSWVAGLSVDVELESEGVGFVGCTSGLSVELEASFLSSASAYAERFGNWPLIYTDKSPPIWAYPAAEASYCLYKRSFCLDLRAIPS